MRRSHDSAQHAILSFILGWYVITYEIIVIISKMYQHNKNSILHVYFYDFYIHCSIIFIFN